MDTKPRISFKEFQALIHKPATVAQINRPTLGELFERSKLESQTSQRPFGKSKLYTYDLIQRAPIAKTYADELTAVGYIEHVKARLAGTAIPDVGPVLPQTVKHDVDQFGLVIERAVRYWKIKGVSVDPLKDAKYIMKEEGLIGKGKARDRRPTEEEIALILAAAILRMKHKRTKIPLHIIFEFAYWSARRIGETCRIVWGDVNYEDRTVIVRDMKDPKNKKGNHVVTPLLGRAWELVIAQPRETNDPNERIFKYHAKSCGAAFRAVCAKLGIKNLRLHDARRECASRAFEGRIIPDRKLTVPEVQLITGHKTATMLMGTYVTLNPRDLTRTQPAQLAAE